MFLKSQDDFYHDKQYVKTGQSKNSCRNWMLHFLFSSIRVFLIWGHLKKKNSIDFLRSKLIFCHNDLSWITMGKSSFLSLLILCLEIELMKSSIYARTHNIQIFKTSDSQTKFLLWCAHLAWAYFSTYHFGIEILAP